MAASYQPPGSDASGTDRPRFLLATAVPEGGADAAAAIALIGGRIIGRIALDAAAAACVGFDGTMVLDLVGGEEVAVQAAVADASTAAAAHRVPLVFAMTLTQVDTVFYAVVGTEAELLCDPDQTQWVRALLTAGPIADAGGLREPGDEAERLARLRGEVARIAEALARLGEGERAPSGAADRRPGFEGPPAEATVTAAEVRDILRARRLRDRFFGAGLFEDPAWDMLLDLFAAELERARVSVSSLCIAAAVAPTTALRWIGRMASEGLLERVPDPADRRRAFVTLSARASEAMRNYFAAARTARLPLA